MWRGSPEQLESRLQTGKTGQFAYFDEELDHPDWGGKAVLDFGGNVGNLLLDRNCSIRLEDYYCLDVLKEALEEGRRRFPHAHWVHYNRYNGSFNPEGVEGLPIPDLQTAFPLILAYSVFTHTTREEMHDLVGQLRTHLAPDGVLAFTFIDPNFRPWPETYKGNNLRWRLQRCQKSNPTVDVKGLLQQGLGADWCSLVDGSELFVNSNGGWCNEAQRPMTYNVFYTAAFMQREFPHATIRPPVNDEMQHCCIIRR